MPFEPKQWQYDDDVTEQELNRMEQGIKEAHDAIAAHLNDFAQVWNNRIVEMGTNANGAYVRWSNGIQICWGSRYWTPPSAGYVRTTVTLPASFLNSDYFVTFGTLDSDSTGYNSDRHVVATARNDNKTISGFELKAFTSGNTNYGIYVNYIAVGRWK